MAIVYDELLDRWGLPRPRSVTATAWGWSNDTFVVASAAGRHILRISTSARQAEVAFEHEVLASVASRRLPFATPLPLASSSGVTLETFAGPHDRLPATLYREIPGRHADDADIGLVAAGASAFAELDRALATVRIATPSRPLSSDLAAVSPAVPTLDGIEQTVGPDAARLLRDTAAGLEALPAGLPRQLIHGDFALGNVLLIGGRVSGIVDFEYCGHDLRAMELATALGLVLTKNNGEDLWRPILTAYLRALPLTDEELVTLPSLVRLGRAAGLLWWIGREREGRSSKTTTAERVERVLAIDQWISRNANELVETARRAV
ncbi:MAG TPA: phosphotransferase [Candidatus Saccharimonadales bacterium]|nr:phosphotransferase [Candidatus Saccharimonadales bacterium]